MDSRVFERICGKFPDCRNALPGSPFEGFAIRNFEVRLLARA